MPVFSENGENLYSLQRQEKKRGPFQMNVAGEENKWGEEEEETYKGQGRAVGVLQKRFNLGK